MGSRPYRTMLLLWGGYVCPIVTPTIIRKYCGDVDTVMSGKRGLEMLYVRAPGARTVPRRHLLGWLASKAHAASLGGRCLTESYGNSHGKYAWRCKEGHTWMATANSVLHGGSWCPQCAASTLRAESAVRRIFEELFFPAKFNSSFPNFLCGLQLDGHCPEMHLAFEHHGQQHYDPDHFFHSKDPQGFAKQRERDDRKAELCERAGIRLVVVPCFVKDKRTFIQLALLRWFTVRQLNPTMLGCGERKAQLGWT